MSKYQVVHMDMLTKMAVWDLKLIVQTTI